MLINLVFLYEKYKLYDINGIIHIGAHALEEKSIYNLLGIYNIIWIEANPEIVNEMKKYGDDKIYCAAISDKDNEVMDFIVTNNYESSSLLELKTHKIEHPHVHEIERFKVKTKRLDTLFEEEKLPVESFNFLNIDIQGAELLALKGAEKVLENIKYIYLEVNEKELYEGCSLLPDIDKFLLEKGFKIVEIKMTNHGWGDAFYIK